MDQLTSPADLLLNQPTRAPSAKSDQTKQAAQDFEAVFLAQMLQPMFATVETDGMFGGGSAEETWRGLMVDEMGKQIARNGGIGLAPLVEQEMLKLQEIADGTH